MYPGSSPTLNGARMQFRIFWLPAGLNLGLNHSAISAGQGEGEPLQMMWAPSLLIPGTHIVSQLRWIPVVKDLDCAQASTAVGGRPCICGTLSLGLSGRCTAIWCLWKGGMGACIGGEGGAVGLGGEGMIPGGYLDG